MKRFYKGLMAVVLIVAAISLIVVPAFAEMPPIFDLKWGSYGPSDGQFKVPYFLALDASGNVYVSDYGNSRVQKFDPNGIFISKWGGVGAGPGQFYGNTGIAISPLGFIYVADIGFSWTATRIEKFDMNGVFISQWGSKGTGNGQFRQPMGMAVDASGNVYVVDKYNYNVQKFDSNGNFILKWGSYGSGNGQFQYPHGIAVDSSNNVYVADQNNHRIQKFNSNGQFLTKWGSNGSGDGQLYGPQGIAIDTLGNIYVADMLNHRMQKFDPNGNFIVKWGAYGQGNGQFLYPGDVKVASSGNIYTLETTFGTQFARVQKFKPANQSPVADAGSDQTTGIYRETPIVFDGSASYDPDNDTLSYSWDFGDGQTGSGAVVTHSYSTLGNKTVTLTVSDGKGGTDTDTCLVTVSNKLPVANAGPDHITNRITSMEFDGSGSADNDGTIATYNWTFGDGSTGTGVNAMHKYSLLGTFNVSLKVTDNDGGQDTDTAVVTVENIAPVAIANPENQTTDRISAASFDGSASKDLDGTIASYVWTLGDGTTKTGKTISHTYTSLGNYEVMLTVKDNDGDSVSDKVNVTVINIPPVADAGADQEGYRNSALTFNGIGSDIDGSIASYSWDFGDGSTASGKTVTHSYANLGTYNVKLMVTDNDGSTAEDTLVVTIKNTPPLADAGPDQTINAVTAAFTATAVLDGSRSTDTDGTISSYSWDFGDGTTGSGATVTHQYTSLGSYTVKLTVTDNDGATSTDTCVVAMKGKFIQVGASGQIKIPMPTASGELPPGLDVEEKTIYLTAEEFALYHEVSQGKSPKTGKGFQVYSK